MGGNSSSRHVSLDSDDEVTFVKGIRLSEKVIDRMKVSPPVVHPQGPTRSFMQSPTTPPVESSVPDERHVPIIPHSPSYASALVPPPLLEPITPLVPPVTEETSTPPSSEGLPIAPPTAAEATSADPMDLPVSSPVELETSPFPISKPNPVPSAMEVSPVSPSGSASDEMLSKTQMGPPSTEKTLVPRLPPVEEPVVLSSFDPVKVFPPQTHVVNEEKLREQIREDLQKLLNEDVKMAERDMRQQLEEETAKAKAQAQAAARLQIQEEVQKVLEEEKASYQQTLADAIRREQLNVQDEHLITQYYWMERKAQKLDKKEKDLQNQEALFQEQIAKMQEKTAQLTKVTAENYRKGLEDATNRFRRYQIKPVCLDLQSQIMKCYTENKGQTMSCSNIASLYIQCVDRAKQDKKLSTGG